MAQYSTTVIFPHNGVPDDTKLQTRLPIICVDYLSHQWQEEDVWMSWRNMTRQKNEIANGVRLENASWRTWWKQRNRLGTISPETLNWLKDSDVTWLYGPLHTATDPPAKASPSEDPFTNTAGRKPILKHRTITEILTIPTPSSPVLESIDLAGHEGGADEAPLPPLVVGRPGLIHTKSDTNLTRRPVSRRDSPPRLVAEGGDPSDIISTAKSSRSDSTSSRRAASDVEGGPGTKKHISFNTFVEQCIAIEAKPQFTAADFDFDDEDDRGGMYDDDDDGALEMKSSSSGSSFGSRKSSMSHSSDKEKLTIAPIAPTILKTSDSFPAPSPAVVFAPPQGSLYHGGATEPAYNVPRTRWMDLPSPPGNSLSSGQWDDDDDVAEGPFDYFRGADVGMGGEYDRRAPLARSGSATQLGIPPPPPPPPHYGTGIPTSAPSIGQTPSPNITSTSPGGSSTAIPVNGFNTRRASPPEDPITASSAPSTSSIGELYRTSREQRSGVPTRGPRSSSPVNVPRRVLSRDNMGPNGSPLNTPNPSLLSPPTSDPPSRGRSASPVGRDMESAPRGRSATRTPSSSFSDRESSSRGTGSPLGSTSPSSSRPSSALGRTGSAGDVRNHQRGTGVPVPSRRDSDSLSPPMGVPNGSASPRSSPTSIVKSNVLKTPVANKPSLIINHSLLGGIGSNAGSEESSMEFPSPGLPLAQSEGDDKSTANTSSATSGLPTPQPTPRKSSSATTLTIEPAESTNPTPVNSPVTGVRPLMPGEVRDASQQGGTLVGRAVEAVTSTLGAIWHAGVGEGRRSSISE